MTDTSGPRTRTTVPRNDTPSTGTPGTGPTTQPVPPLTPEEFEGAVLSRPLATAIFDCDGTLWKGDAGYEFMTWSLEQGLVDRSTADWILGRYSQYRRGEVSEIAICSEMVQMYVGLRETELRSAAKRFFLTCVEPYIFPQMLALTQQLRSRGTEIWAVSSTNIWVIEEGVERFGIPAERVLGARATVRDGIVAETLIDVPTGLGKASALIAAGVPHPGAVFGNSIHDLAMLELAGRPFAINPSVELLAAAQKKSWPVFYPHAKDH